MPKWEYLRLRWTWNQSEGWVGPPTSDATLNQLGDEGWEIVAAYTVSQSPSFPGITSTLVYVLKRPKP